MSEYEKRTIKQIERMVGWRNNRLEQYRLEVKELQAENERLTEIFKKLKRNLDADTMSIYRVKTYIEQALKGE